MRIFEEGPVLMFSAIQGGANVVDFLLWKPFFRSPPSLIALPIHFTYNAFAASLRAYHILLGRVENQVLYFWREELVGNTNTYVYLDNNTPFESYVSVDRKACYVHHSLAATLREITCQIGT
jgi:hypothetical protein